MFRSVYNTVFFSALLLVIGAIEPQEAHAESYIDFLENRSETVMVRRYQSQLEIDGDIHGQPDHDALSYDETINGARFRQVGANGRQLRPNFGTIDSGTVLITWESRWDAGYSSNGDVDGLRTHKAFQISKNGPSDQRRMEIRALYSSVDEPDVARLDHRRYIWNTVGDASPLAGQIDEFIIKPNTWTRFWSFMDFDNGTYSHWVADEDTNPVQLFDRLPIDYSNNLAAGVDNFWFEYNSSQSRNGPVLYTWARNFAVLKNLSNDPGYYVQIGAQVAADVNGNFPNPPIILQGN